MRYSEYFIWNIIPTSAVHSSTRTVTRNISTGRSIFFLNFLFLTRSAGIPRFIHFQHIFNVLNLLGITDVFIDKHFFLKISPPPFSYYAFMWIRAFLTVTVLVSMYVKYSIIMFTDTLLKILGILFYQFTPNR